MITLITGKKGSGKTKRLIDMCNLSAEQSKGNVIFIEKTNDSTYNVSHKARLAVADEYAISGFTALYGFMAGMCAGNYDITDIYVDSTLISQETSPTSQFECINSLVLSLLYGPTLTSIHDNWKNHSFDYMHFCWQSNVSTF